MNVEFLEKPFTLPEILNTEYLKRESYVYFSSFEIEM